MSSATEHRHSPLGLFPDRPAPRLYDRIVEVLRVRHDSRRVDRMCTRLWTLDSRLFHGIRTVQELLGHKDVKTTMIYTHVLNRGGRGVRSPLEGIRELLANERTQQNADVRRADRPA